MSKKSQVKPNHQSPPGPIGNTQGLIVPDTAPNLHGNNAPAIKPTKEEKSWWESWGSDVIHTGLDVVGLIPGVGEIADGANALIYLAEGDKVNAAISAAAMIPGAGMAATGAKYGKKVVGAVAEGVAKKGGREAAEAAAEKGVKEATEETAEQAAKKGNPGGKDKGKPKGKKPDCGKRGAYNKQDGDFAGHEMERDHVPSGAALKEAILERAKKSGEKFSAAQLKSLENKAVQHAQTIAVPNEVHAAGETYKSKNKPLYKDDAKDLAGAAKRDNAAHRKNIDNDKHKGCKGALNKAADEIDAITNDQYNKYFDKLIDDVLDGKNTIDPWKGIM